MKQALKKMSVFVVMLMLFPTASVFATEDYSKVPVKGTVTMIDLGAKKCIPCKK